jgi:hypothetical protein
MKNNLLLKATEFIDSLPNVDLGKSLTENNLFQGSEKVFYDFYIDILGSEKVSEILSLYGFERSALFGLHHEAVKINAIPKTHLLALANGDKTLIGFAYQYPTNCKSWVIPGKHFMAELWLGKAITRSISID